MSAFSNSQSAARPYQRLLAQIDLTRLPEADDLDEMILRIEALEQHIQTTHTVMNARMASLQAALARAEASNRELAARAALAEHTPALAHDLASALCSAGLVSDTLSEQVDQFRQHLAAGPLRRSALDTFLTQLDEGLRVIGAAHRHAGTLGSSLKHIAIDSDAARQRRFALREVVDDVLTLLQPALRRAKVSLQCDIDSTLMLDSQPGALAQVLLNLVQNALVHAYTDEQAACMSISASTQGESIVLIVEDNGRGMSADTLARCFTPYFSTGLARGGSGLGLAHARELAEKSLGGQLDATSELGVGSCFTLTLPTRATV